MQRLISILRRPVAVLIAAAGLLMLTPAVSLGGLTFYATQSGFNAASPGLPVEHFSSANLFGQPYVTQANGLSSATNNNVFAGGSILPGLTVSTVKPGLQSTGG